MFSLRTSFFALKIKYPKCKSIPVLDKKYLSNTKDDKINCTYPRKFFILEFNKFKDLNFVFKFKTFKHVFI